MKFEPVNNVVNKYMQDLKDDFDSDSMVQQNDDPKPDKVEPKIQSEVGQYFKPSKFEDRKIKS